MNPETLTRQSLTNFDYLALIGIANWVFNSNVEFLIENIDKEHHGRSNISWFVLIEETAGQLVQKHEKLIRLIIGDTGFELFRTLIAKRNAIVHAIPTGEKDDGYPIAIYREKNTRNSLPITKAYLLDFIKQNEHFCDLLYAI